MNKKERKLACATALQSAAADMLVCDDFGALEAVSTKGLVASLAAMGVQEGEKVLLVVNEANEKLYLSGRNLPTLAINTANAVQVRAGAVGVAVWEGSMGSMGSGACGWSGTHRVPAVLLVLEAAGVLLVRRLSPGCSHCWPCLPCCHHATHTPHSRTPQVYDVLNADRIVVEQSALAYLNEWFGESQA